MLNDIVAVKPVKGYRLHLKFEDQVEGEVDLSHLINFNGVFALLQDLEEFAKVRVDAETGTICWPNGADLDPLVLYAHVTGTDISQLLLVAPKSVS
ncbi:MAG: DUF2442 domain-containing protein [Acidobacteriota bacterium]